MIFEFCRNVRGQGLFLLINIFISLNSTIYQSVMKQFHVICILNKQHIYMYILIIFGPHYESDSREGLSGFKNLA